MHFMGVDCGGTKTQFVISDENGAIRAEYRTGRCSFFSLPRDGIRDLIASGTQEVCRLAGIDPSLIAYAGLGFPGYGEKEGSEEIIRSACAEALGHDRFVCACDCALGWAGSLAMEPGVNVIAGTGSNCYGVNEAGESARASGWGAFCDEGSCRWIGQKLIQLFTKQSDGRLPRTLLYDRFRMHMGIEKDEHFIYSLNHELQHNASAVAKLQMLAHELCLEGDPYARKIYDEAACELAQTVHAVARKLGMRPGYRASFSGGLFRTGDVITGPLAREVAMLGGTLCYPRYTPDQGALLMAMRAFDPSVRFDGLTFDHQEEKKPW